MKKYVLFAILLIGIIGVSCSGDPGMKVKAMPAIVSEGFISDTEYEVVSIGYPKEGLTNGLQQEFTAKDAAITYAQMFLKVKFDDTVRPEMDGEVKDFEMVDGHAKIKYVIKKSNLKNRLKK